VLIVTLKNQKEVFMEKAKDGDTVSIHYTGMLESGEVFESTKERNPIEITLGNRRVIPGVEKGILGMSVGETKTFEVSPEEGFGEKMQEFKTDVKRGDLPEQMTPVIGQPLKVEQPDGESFVMFISDMNEETVTLDANHPLAGQTLTFTVELLAVR
jgi:FKBP-type peptidyl-prolyl cis-trans isomerase 2